MSEESGIVSQTREFYATKRRQDARKKNLTNEIGATLAAFVDKTELNKTAVGIIGRLDKLSPDKRADVLRSLDTIREAMSGVWGQEESAEMDFSAGETGVAAAQAFERERRGPSRKKATATAAAKAEAARLAKEAKERKAAATVSEDSLEHLTH